MHVKPLFCATIMLLLVACVISLVAHWPSREVWHPQTSNDDSDAYHANDHEVVQVQRGAMQVERVAVTEIKDLRWHQGLVMLALESASGASRHPINSPIRAVFHSGDRVEHEMQLDGTVLKHELTWPTRADKLLFLVEDYEAVRLNGPFDNGHDFGTVRLKSRSNVQIEVVGKAEWGAFEVDIMIQRRAASGKFQDRYVTIDRTTVRVEDGLGSNKLPAPANAELRVFAQSAGTPAAGAIEKLAAPIIVAAAATVPITVDLRTTSTATITLAMDHSLMKHSVVDLQLGGKQAPSSIHGIRPSRDGVIVVRNEALVPGLSAQVHLFACDREDYGVVRLVDMVGSSKWLLRGGSNVVAQPSEEMIGIQFSKGGILTAGAVGVRNPPKRQTHKMCIVRRSSIEGQPLLMGRVDDELFVWRNIPQTIDSVLPLMVEDGEPTGAIVVENADEETMIIAKEEVLEIAYEGESQSNAVVIEGLVGGSYTLYAARRGVPLGPPLWAGLRVTPGETVRVSMASEQRIAYHGKVAGWDQVVSDLDPSSIFIDGRRYDLSHDGAFLVPHDLAVPDIIEFAGVQTAGLVPGILDSIDRANKNITVRWESHSSERIELRCPPIAGGRIGFAVAYEDDGTVLSMIHPAVPIGQRVFAGADSSGVCELIRPKGKALYGLVREVEKDRFMWRGWWRLGSGQRTLHFDWGGRWVRVTLTRGGIGKVYAVRKHRDGLPSIDIWVGNVSEIKDSEVWIPDQATDIVCLIGDQALRRSILSIGDHVVFHPSDER